ncbi:MAG: diacylglycerol kinase family protein [Candidatus Margulisbacteria bacterium]|nr:diacylglycerol kinase family protein [Candidatus Margulisiibacteriota bacterium]
MPKKFMHSFKYAHAGTRHALATQRNIWIHLFVGLAAIVAAIWLRISLAEMALLALTISFVIVAEMFNTAIEVVVDLAKPEKHPQAAIAKNVAAGAVLIAAFASVLVGFFIFLPRLMR